MRSSGSGAGPDWRFIHVGLIVTGETEERCLPELFRSMAATGMCSFSVIRRIGQRSPIRSDRRRLKMVGRGKMIPDRDETEIPVLADIIDREAYSMPKTSRKRYTSKEALNSSSTSRTLSTSYTCSLVLS